MQLLPTWHQSQLQDWLPFCALLVSCQCSGQCKQAVALKCLILFRYITEAFSLYSDKPKQRYAHKHLAHGTAHGDVWEKNCIQKLLILLRMIILFQLFRISPTSFSPMFLPSLLLSCPQVTNTHACNIKKNWEWPGNTLPIKRGLKTFH